MDYEGFKDAFLRALADSRLPPIGRPPARETLDLGRLDRKCSIAVEPIDRDVARPFHVSGMASWRWHSTHTARSATSEEGLLSEILGQEAEVYEIETEQSLVRVDLKLSATLEMTKVVPMPTSGVLTSWRREVEAIISLTPEEIDDGSFAIRSWQGDPELNVSCASDGALRLHGVELPAFQLIQLPRRWDSSDREPDEGPEEQLAGMFQRLKTMLAIWSKLAVQLDRSN